ncbi:MAG: hypothetical protein JXR69_01595 [Candidatus Delongbacteria bacterium]|nr:hypothetical protein [Candidatus Delongbacteria bacterium]
MKKAILFVLLTIILICAQIPDKYEQIKELTTYYKIGSKQEIFAENRVHRVGFFGFILPILEFLEILFIGQIHVQAGWPLEETCREVKIYNIFTRVIYGSEVI